MWGPVLCALGAVALARAMNNEPILGKGQWLVENVNACPDSHQNPYAFEMKRRKLNRTHDGFSVAMHLTEEINELSHGIYISVCKKVDGGCKLQYTFADASFCDFIKRYAEGNFHAALTNAGLQNPDCPIPKGAYEIKDFMFNYLELREDGMLGNFTATCYITKWEKRVACALVDLSFMERNED